MPFPLEIRFVRRAEEQLGRGLPASYIARMCRSNGGTVDDGTETWELHPIFDDSDRTRLKRSCNHIIRETATSREYSPDIFPPDALAIANNGGGDLLILLPGPHGREFDDRVYRWSHETGEVEIVAEDFADLTEG